MAEAPIQTPKIKVERPKKPHIKKSQISNLEWGSIIGILSFIDLVELILGLFAVGELINTFIDWVVGPVLYTYLWFRGEQLNDPRRMGSFVGAFVLEMIPFVNDFPLWCFEGIYLYVLSRNQNTKAERAETRYQQMTLELAAYEKRAKILALQRKKELQKQRQEEEEEEMDEEFATINLAENASQGYSGYEGDKMI